MRPAENDEPDWIRLRLVLAQAHRQYADKLAKSDPRDKAVLISREAARRLARFVARYSGPYQEAGRLLVRRSRAALLRPGPFQKTPPRRLKRPDSRGTDAIAEMQSAEYFLANVPARSKRETNEQVRARVAEEACRDGGDRAVETHEALDNLTLALEVIRRRYARGGLEPRAAACWPTSIYVDR